MAKVFLPLFSSKLALLSAFTALKFALSTSCCDLALSFISLNDFLKKFHNNSKKWIRLRKTNKKTTLTVKHILEDNGSNIQQMLETEMVVPSLEAANEFLKALGFSYKSYQEKRRISYILKNHEIDIDTWPGLSTYMEIEGESEEDIQEILVLLGYSMKDTISCTVDEIYKKRGIDILNIRELKF